MSIELPPWSNWIELRKLKYFKWCLIDLSNSIWNTSISGVKPSWTTLIVLVKSILPKVSPDLFLAESRCVTHCTATYPLARRPLRVVHPHKLFLFGRGRRTVVVLGCDVGVRLFVDKLQVGHHHHHHLLHPLHFYKCNLIVSRDKGWY